MQNDFNAGCEFAFVVLEDMGRNSDKEKRLVREKQYIYAFLDKFSEVYNYESRKMLMDHLFYLMVIPTISGIQNDFHKNFGCPMRGLTTCKVSTLKKKFASRVVKERKEKDIGDAN